MISMIPSLLTLWISALWCALGAALVVTGAGSGIAAWFQLPSAYILQSTGVLIILLLILFAFLPQHRPCRQFGLANSVTLLRASITALLAGLIGLGELNPDLAWCMTALAGIALISDGVDGWLARRCAIQSRFGARFDMEVDAFLILVLTGLMYQMGKAGFWVLLSGILRYGFVGLAYFFPWLRLPLPPRKRRQTICVLQTTILGICLIPPITPPLSTLLCAVGLTLLLFSFATDMVWLYRHAHICPSN